MQNLAKIAPKPRKKNFAKKPKMVKKTIIRNNLLKVGRVHNVKNVNPRE